MTDTSTARNIDEQLLDINMCIHFSMIACIPSSGIIKKKPWISPVTLELLERKQAYRVQNNFEMEKSTHKLIKKQVKKDRSCWLDEMISTGGWKDIKRFRKIVKRKTHNRQLRNTDGSIIEESQRSQSMAEYFETYQWHVRPDCIISEKSTLFATELPISNNRISLEELRIIIQHLKNDKATGLDEIPAEIWKAIAEDNDALLYLVEICNECWNNRKIPKSWHKANIVSLFKKGDANSLYNYRPISLLQVSYKFRQTDNIN